MAVFWRFIPEVFCALRSALGLCSFVGLDSPPVDRGPPGWVVSFPNLGRGIKEINLNFLLCQLGVGWPVVWGNFSSNREVVRKMRFFFEILGQNGSKLYFF